MKRFKNNILMRELNRPKKVTLLNGRTFYAKYKRVRINLLLNNMRITRRYRRREIGKQGKEIKNVLKRRLSLAQTKVRKSLAKITIKNAPTLYNKVWIK